MSKILVTGGLGLIGHNVVARLQQQGHDVAIVDNQTNYGIVPQDELDYLLIERAKKISPHTKHFLTSIEDSHGVDYIMSEYRPEIVIHMASFPRQKVVNANPAYGARVMMEGLINVLESAKAYGTGHVVYISSSMVYGDFDDQVTEDVICNPQGQYGIMKLAGENLVKDYSRRGSFTYSIIRPSAVYGPLDVEDRVIAKFMLTAMRGGTLKVNGAGETLDFTYVDDAADGIVAAATLPTATNKTYNITKSHSVSLLQAAQSIVSIVGKGSVDVKDKDPDFPSRGALNIDAAKQDLGYSPKVDVQEGFLNYYTWIKESEFWKAKLSR